MAPRAPTDRKVKDQSPRSLTVKTFLVEYDGRGELGKLDR